MLKVKDIKISGLRGIKKDLNLTLNSPKSVLIYGDNGSGKSSITDAVEWFYKDKVEHLSSEEIGRKGIDALRNISLSDEEDAYIELKFSDSGLDSRKRLFYQRSKLASEYSNSTEEFNAYVKDSLQENLTLRYKDLLRFILYTKTQKLEEISQIIGFSEVIKIKGVLKKAVNDLKKVVKTKNFDSQVSQKQAQIIEQVKQPIHNDEQYFDAIRELVNPLKLSVEVKDNASINTVLKLIEMPEDKEILSQQISYEKVIGILNNLKSSVESIHSSYGGYYKKYQKIFRDIDKFKKVGLEKLLSEGLLLLEKGIFEEGKCPLCLQDKNRNELIEELRGRIDELADFKKEKEELEEGRETTQRYLQNILSEIETILKEKCLSIKENSGIRNEMEQTKELFSNALDRLKKVSLLEREELKNPEEFVCLDNSKVQKMVSAFRDNVQKISAGKKDDIRFSISRKLVLVRQAYTEIKSFKKESAIINRHMQSMELICNEFVRKQKDALTSFLKAISKDINELYICMNRSERVDAIELVPLGEEDELVGITIQFKFHGNIVSPPDKYLSESHLNCLGICLFLSSVKAFNSKNTFFILDDVISSFDKGHRARFVSLLMEKFSDYQIFLFTHEHNWFEYVANTVKGKNWIITRIVWNDERGAELESPLFNLKEMIEDKIKKSDSSDLGNMVRRYLEKLLKETCFCWGAKVNFLYNDQNENRTSNELLSELRSTLKRRKSEPKDHRVWDRLSQSVFIGHKASHDSGYLEDINDVKAFYDDVLELEALFCCSKCSKYIAIKYCDPVKHTIRCSCGGITYSWKT